MHLKKASTWVDKNIMDLVYTERKNLHTIYELNMNKNGLQGHSVFYHRYNQMGYLFAVQM